MKLKRWNTILKRGIAFGVAVLTVISSISLPSITYAKATELNDRDTYGMESASVENDVHIKGTNSFGELLNEAIQNELDEQECQDYQIYSVDMSGNTATVEYDTVIQSQLIVGIYDDAGEKFLASGNTIVEAGSTEANVEIEIDTMPTYYHVKAYLIEPNTLAPLSRVFDCPNYTQEMQEFLAKTTDDFVGEEILNLDEDKTNNFGVFADDVIYVAEQPDVNRVTSEDSDTMTYVIEDATESIVGLTEGNIFALEYDTNCLLIVKVGSIQVDGTTVAIVGQDVEMEEVFKYLKLDADAGLEDAQVDASNLQEGVTYLGIYDEDEESTDYEMPDETTAEELSSEEAGDEETTTEEATEESSTEAASEEEDTETSTEEAISEKEADTDDINNCDNNQAVNTEKSHDIHQYSKHYEDVAESTIEDEISPDRKEDEYNSTDNLTLILEDIDIGPAKVNGTLNHSSAVELKYYISTSKRFVSVKIDYSVSLNISISLGLDEDKTCIPISLPWIMYIPVPSIIVTITPSVIFEPQVEGEFAAKITGSIGVIYDNGKIKNASIKPKIVCELKVEGSFFIGISLEPKIGILGSVVELSLEAKGGVEMSLAKTFSTDKDDSSVHSCKLCFEGDVKAKLTLSAKAEFLKKFKVKRSFDLWWKLSDCYFSVDNLSFDFTTCPCKRYKTEIEVVDEDGEPVLGAGIDGNYWTMKDGKPVSGTSIVTNVDGKAIIYLPEGMQDISINKSGYKPVCKNIDKATESSKCKFIIKKQVPDKRIDADTFPDKTFREYVKANFDLDGDGKLSKEEADEVTSIHVGYKKIKRLEGIECFENLKTLDCKDNQLSSLDVSKNTNLETLVCYGNELSSLDVSENKKLETLDCSSNQLRSLDVSQNENLETLDCSYNQLKNLDVSQNKNLGTLECRDNQLSNLDVSGAITLTKLGCSWNQLSSLDVSENKNLEELFFCGNQLDSLDISQNKDLELLDCYKNQLSSLDVSENKNLEKLDCCWNKLSSLDVSENKNLKRLDCGGNELSSLDVSGAITLTKLGCTNNQLDSLDVSQNKDLELLDCYKNELSSLDVSQNKNLKDLDCAYNQLSNLDVSQNKNLEELDCTYNQLSNLDVSQNKNLKRLDCYKNQLSSLDVSQNVNLQWLYYDSNVTVIGWPRTDSLSADSNSQSEDVVSKDIERTVDDRRNDLPQEEELGVKESSDVNNEENVDRTEVTSPSIYTDLIPNAVYNYYIMKYCEDGLSAGNLLYITQVIADQYGEVSIPFAYNTDWESPETMLVCMEKTDISTATITIDDMYYNTQVQQAQLKVELNGSVLTEGHDYQLSGDYSATEAGSYTVRINGIGMYTGLVDKEYQMNPAKVSSISVSSKSLKLKVGQTKRLTTVIVPDYAENKIVTWKSSNTKVATVDSTGKITAKSAGTATITCTAKDGSGVKATCKVTVTNPITKITLNKTSAFLTQNEVLTLTKTIAPSNATNKTVTWASSNTKVATVDSNGKVTAKSAGTTTITCTAKDGSGAKATCKITVYTNTEAFVARIYTKALGRDPEPAGLKYWTNEINTKKRTPVNVAESFFFAPEFTNKNLSDTEYIKVLYRTFMGREYDQGGLTYWLGRLAKGESRKSVMKAFASCPEFQNIIKSFGL